ncbi:MULTISPECIES: NAD(P)-binding domain-containing protein [unclassified Streptomyces]|uniref:NADPH-dependent F420 reductase n=1 Tax=unclassified Streptomyces TaxID=2593676 RepID=UPI002E8181E9|nr:NAD(P)-binding domain-containing protein [Streptomyces sp. NBC_00569]WSE13514.1 NAD(P)-binding domain-containing protein [Streptomyces sp. NBC_01397]WUB97568.1 NAD(P)-binding domain-containing protein [Streptomyces sp. NBC_00569]
MPFRAAARSQEGQITKLTAIGAGAIGGNLACKLAAAGHDVQVADARGPEAVPADVLEPGARAVPLDSAVRDRDVIIMSIPFERAPELADVLALVSDETVVIDTTNYYPHLSGPIEAVDSGQVESVRNAEALGRPLAKAWNAALAETPRMHEGPEPSPRQPRRCWRAHASTSETLNCSFAFRPAPNL